MVLGCTDHTPRVQRLLKLLDRLAQEYGSLHICDHGILPPRSNNWLGKSKYRSRKQVEYADAMRLRFFLAFTLLTVCCLPSNAQHKPFGKLPVVPKPDRVDKLFAQLKNDSSYGLYVKRQQVAMDIPKRYADSLRKHGIEAPNLFADSLGLKEAIFAEVNPLLEANLRLRQMLIIEYPVLGQLSYGEQRKLERLSQDYFFKQPAQRD
jgi:hypothetical protein